MINFDCEIKNFKHINEVLQNKNSILETKNKNLENNIKIIDNNNNKTEIKILKSEISALNHNINQLINENSKLQIISKSTNKIDIHRDYLKSNLFKSIIENKCEINFNINVNGAKYRLINSNNSITIINDRESNYFGIHNLERNNKYEFIFYGNINEDYNYNLSIIGIGININLIEQCGFGENESKFSFLLPGIEIY